MCRKSLAQKAANQQCLKHITAWFLDIFAVILDITSCVIYGIISCLLYNITYWLL